MQYLILENIRSAYNVGAIFRTADAAGVTKVFLVGYTPQPIDRFGRAQSTIAKTSLGASATVPWTHYDNIATLAAYLRAEPVPIVAVEQAPEAVALPAFAAPPKVAYLFGNEVTGVSGDGLNAADTIVEIPMLGSKESLNVSVSAGVVLYHGLAQQQRT